MGKVIIKIGETEYTADNFTYSLNRNRGCPPEEVNNISVSLNIMGKNNLDALMLRGPFGCTVTTYDESGTVFRQFEFINAEIISYSGNVYTQSGYLANIQLEAEIMRFDGTAARAKLYEE
jgi:hypothetical protein